MRVGVTILSLLIAVGAAILAVQAIDPSGNVASAAATSSELFAFIATLAVVGGVTLTVGLSYVERSFQRSKRKARRRTQ